MTKEVFSKTLHVDFDDTFGKRCRQPCILQDMQNLDLIYQSVIWDTNWYIADERPITWPEYQIKHMTMQVGIFCLHFD